MWGINLFFAFVSQTTPYKTKLCFGPFSSVLLIDAEGGSWDKSHNHLLENKDPSLFLTAF